MRCKPWISTFALLAIGTACTKKSDTPAAQPAAAVSAESAAASATAPSPAVDAALKAATDSPTTPASTSTQTATATDTAATPAAAPEVKPRTFEARDIAPGTGPEAKDGSTVTIHYVGTLEDGQKFDSSRDRQAPLTFTLGKGEQIQGWDKGIAGMKVGGKRALVIPAELGYGDKGVKGVIPPNANLFFEVELLSIK